MLKLATFTDLQELQHTLGLYCLRCDRWGEADLAGLISRGRGHRRVVESRFRCRSCGELVDKQLRPPVPEVGGAVGYIGG